MKTDPHSVIFIELVPRSEASIVHDLDVIRRIVPATRMVNIPDLRLHAVFDPYRRGLRSELDDVKEKNNVGATGLFTQPFFDLEFIKVCADLLPDVEVFRGLSAVLTDGSRRYWEVKNRAFFPSRFESSLEWNRAFAAECIEWATASDMNLVSMPIRVGLEKYLGGLIP